MSDIKSILEDAVCKGASDVHINVGMPPIVRKNTELFPLDFPEVSNADAREMVLAMVGPEKIKGLEEDKELEFSATTEDGHRFRVNAHYQRETIAICFRVIPNQVPSIEDLNMPPVIKRLTELPRGLVLVTGHTGAGKSTTLAAMVDCVNSKSGKRIITIEDPIEYALENKKSMIEQREIGADCPCFASGLRHALRQDPDVLMVGEMRDLETTSSTITAAETGHLVFSTLHTINAPQTVERIIDIYPASQQNQIRTMLANTLQAVVSQTLFKRTDRYGMVPCVEILLCTAAVRNCIRENRLFEIHNIIQTSKKAGMQTMDGSIADMCLKGLIDRDEAIARSNDPVKMEKTLSAAVPVGAA